MKRQLILITIIFLTQNVFAQNISPYYPAPFFSSTLNKYECQFTYFDLNFVSLNIQDFMSRKFAMSQDGSQSKYNLKEGKGTISNVYIDQISINREPRKIKITYTIFPIEKEFVIKSVKITGNADVVLKFYVYFWSTTLNFDDVSKKEAVSNRYFQDRISYSYNNGNSYIQINNTTVKDDKNFIDNFIIKKTKYNKEKIEAEKKEEILKQEKIKEKEIKLEKLKIKKEKEKQEEEKQQEEKELAYEEKLNTKNLQFSYKVIKTKKKVKIELIDTYQSDKYATETDIEQKLKEFLSDKNKGTYTIRVNYTTIYDKLTDTELKVKNYQKPKSALDIIREISPY